MTKLKVLFPLLLSTLGCNLILDGANDGVIGDDEAGDEGVEEEGFTQNLWCTLHGACVVSLPGVGVASMDDTIQYWAFQSSNLPYDYDMTPTLNGSCEDPLVVYPCGIIANPVVEIDPFTENGTLDPDAFLFKCALCPENTPWNDWHPGPQLDSSQVPFCMDIYEAYNRIEWKTMDTYLSDFNQWFEPDACPFPQEPFDPENPPSPLAGNWVPKFAPRGFVTYQLDKGPIGLCESDIDCAYLTELYPPGVGEGVCEGWPFFRTVDPVSGVQVDIPRGCFRVTDENGGVVPPIPSVGGMMVEDNLSCGDLTCEVTMPFVEAIIDDAITASVGMFWRISDDAIYLTDVKSYSLGSLMGLQTGDVIRGSVEDLGSKYAHLVEHGTAEITILRGRETKTLRLNVVE